MKFGVREICNVVFRATQTQYFGDIEVKKTFNINGQKEVIVKLSKEDIENIGIGQHRWYADLQYGDEQDTIVYQTIAIIEKDV